MMLLKYTGCGWQVVVAPNLGKVLSQKKLESFAIFDSEAVGKAVLEGDHSGQLGLLSTQPAMLLSRQDPAEPLSLEEAEYLISCMLPCIYIA